MNYDILLFQSGGQIIFFSVMALIMIPLHELGHIGAARNLGLNARIGWDKKGVYTYYPENVTPIQKKKIAFMGIVAGFIPVFFGFVSGFIVGILLLVIYLAGLGDDIKTLLRG